jgi:hypothetical protein
MTPALPIPTNYTSPYTSFGQEQDLGGGAPSLEATTAGSKEDNKKIAALGREARWQTGLKSVADTYR